MENNSFNWLSRLRRWLCSEPRLLVHRTARPIVESLEDRTGLSSTPVLLTAAHVGSYFQVQADTNTHHRPPTGTDQPDSTLQQETEDTTDTGNDPVIAMPPGTDELETQHTGFTPNQPEISAFPLGKEQNQHKGSIHDEAPRTGQQPLILSVSSFEALQQTGKSLPNTPGTIAASSADAYFQIQRTPVTQQPLDVQYEVKAFTSNGVEAREQSARFAAGAGKIDITDVPQALRQQRDVQIITLTLHEHKQYQLARPGATIFIANHQQGFSESALLRACHEGHSSEALSRYTNTSSTS